MRRDTNSYMPSYIRASDCCCFWFILKRETRKKLTHWCKKKEMYTYLINVHSMNHFKSAKSVACAHLKSVCIAVFDRSLLNETLQWRWGVAGPESPPPPQGQGWNILAGAGRQAQHIWRLKVTSSPCRHPSAHKLECVSFTKYSVCRGPVNAWLFLDSARWRTLLAGSAETHTSAWMSCTYISLYPAGDLLLLKNGNWASLVWPLCNA